MSSAQSICIFCREPKTNFTDEHVFSATIGGAFVITTVCKECNEKLGKLVDDPLVRHEMILLRRQEFQIKRVGKIGTRHNIPNPFRGTYEDEDGGKYIVQFNDGKASSKLIPKYDEPIPVEGGYMASWTIPLENFTSEDDVKKLFAKKYNIDPDKVIIKDKQVNPSKAITINKMVPNNPFILGALKVAYEYAMTFLPEYMNDSSSLVLRDILLSGSPNENQKKHLVEDLEIKKELALKVNAMEGMGLHHHIAILTYKKGQGLYCFVKLFELAYLVKLSNNNYALKQDLTLINDSILQMWWINVTASLNQFSVFVDLAQFDQKMTQELQGYGRDTFKAPNGNIPVFNSLGEQTHAHLTDLVDVNAIQQKFYDHTQKLIIVPYDCFGMGYFVKSFDNLKIFPLLHVNYLHQLQY